MFDSPTEFTASAILARVPGSESVSDRVMLRKAVSANRSTFAGFVRVPAETVCRASADMKVCWLLIRPRSLPSPTPWRDRRNAAASAPDSCCGPACRSSAGVTSVSRIGVARHTGTPPTASAICTTPSKVILPA